MKNIILKTGINGGSSTISIDPTTIKCLDLGVDKKVRVIYGDGERSFPILDIIKSSDEFRENYLDLLEVAEDGLL